MANSCNDLGKEKQNLNETYIISDRKKSENSQDVFDSLCNDDNVEKPVDSTFIFPRRPVKVTYNVDSPVNALVKDASNELVVDAKKPLDSTFVHPGLPPKITFINSSPESQVLDSSVLVKYSLSEMDTSGESLGILSPSQMRDFTFCVENPSFNYELTATKKTERSFQFDRDTSGESLGILSPSQMRDFTFCIENPSPKVNELTAKELAIIELKKSDD